MKKLLTLLVLVCMACTGAWAYITPGSYAIKVHGTNKYLNPTNWTVKGNDRMAYTTSDRPAWVVLDGTTANTNVISVEGSTFTLNPYHYQHATDPQTTVGCWQQTAGQRHVEGEAEWLIEPVESVSGAYTIRNRDRGCYLSYDAGSEYVLMTATSISSACYFVIEDLSVSETPLLTIGCVSDVHCMNNMITPSSGNLDDITVRSSLTTVLNRMKTEDNPDVLVFGGDSESDKTIAEENSNKVRQVLAEAMRSVFQEGKNPNVLWLTGNHDYEVANFPSGRTETDKPYNAGNFYEFPMKQDIGQLPESDLFYEDADNGEYGTERILAAYHYVLNGFDFVVLNCGKYFFRNAWDYTFSTESATWVQNKLQEIDPDGTKTVFFLCHVPFPDSNSINASGSKGMNTTEGYPILKAACAAHPNLIMLYGHDHGQDNAYIREKTSQRVTLYDPSGNVITTTDANHVDGTTQGETSEGGETSEEMDLSNICLKSKSGQYFGIDGSNNIVMQNTPYSFTCGEIDGVDNAHNLKLASASRWINSGTNGLLSTTNTNNDDNIRHFYFYEVTSNNGSTITAKQVEAPSANKDYLLGVSNIKSGSNGFFVVYAQAGNSSSVRLDVVRINSSSVVTLTNGKKTVSDIPTNITLTASNTDSYGNPVVFNKVLWQVEKVMTTGTFYVTHDGQHLIKDSNNLNLGSTATEHALEAGSATGTFKLKTSSTQYLHIGSGGRWSDGTATNLLLFDTNGKRVYNIVSGDAYYIVALNGSYYAMKGAVYSPGNSSQRMDTQAVTLNSDQTQMTTTPGADFQWTFTDVNAASSNPDSTTPQEASFFSSFMGSLRYYYNAFDATDPADMPTVVQALVVKVYNDRVELHMKNYNQTGNNLNGTGINIAETPTPYTSFRTVTHSDPVEYPKEGVSAPKKLQLTFSNITSTGATVTVTDGTNALSGVTATLVSISSDNNANQLITQNNALNENIVCPKYSNGQNGYYDLTFKIEGLTGFKYNVAKLDVWGLNSSGGYQNSTGRTWDVTLTGGISQESLSGVGSTVNHDIAPGNPPHTEFVYDTEDLIQIDGTYYIKVHAAKTCSFGCFCGIKSITLAAEQKITYSYKYNGEEKYSQKVPAVVGEAFPEASWDAPYGVDKNGVPDRNVEDGDVDQTFDITLTLADDYPFVPSTSFSDAHWYKLGFRPDWTYYVYYTPSSATNVMANNATNAPMTEANRKNYGWAFVGNPFDGYTIVNNGAGETMSLTSANNPRNLVTADGKKWLLASPYQATTNGHINFSLVPADGSTTDRNNLQSNTIKRWSGNDVGSAFWVEELDLSVDGAFREKKEEALRFITYSSVLFGDESVEGSAAYIAKTAIEGIVYDSSSEQSVASAISSLEGYMRTFYAAANGKEIVFYNTNRNNKYMVVVDAVQLSGASEVDGRSAFQVNYVEDSNGQFTLKNIATGRYIANTPSTSNRVQLSTTPGKFTIKSWGTDNKFAFICVNPGNSQHNSLHLDGSHNVVAWEADGEGNASVWVIQPSELTAEQLAAGEVAVKEQAIAIARNFKNSLPDNMFGDGLNQYKQSDDFDAAATAIDNATTSSSFEELMALKPALQTAGSELVINQPKENTFLRVRNAGGSNKRISCVNAEGGKLVCANDENVDKIFFYDGTHLLAYKTGMYVGIKDNFLTNCTEVAANTGTTFAFSGSPKFPATYNVVFNGNRYLYDDGNAGSNAANNTDKKYTFWLEEVTSLPVTFRKVGMGYATLYSPVALQIPGGVEAYIAVNEGDHLKAEKLDGTIPAETGVVLFYSNLTADTTVDFEVANTTSYVEQDNVLTGTYATKAVTNGNLDSSYVFALRSEKPGFYRYSSAEGATLAGFKAYYETSAESSTRGFALDFGGVVTAISQLSALNSNLSAIYDLAGRRVSAAQKGILIQNGNKVIR